MTLLWVSITRGVTFTREAEDGQGTGRDEGEVNVIAMDWEELGLVHVCVQPTSLLKKLHNAVYHLQVMPRWFNGDCCIKRYSKIFTAFANNIQQYIVLSFFK
jgi:hypothetical protein